jgi:tetraacyldisaccharide 4'-kinase
LRILLSPVSLIYWGVTSVRNFLYDYRLLKSFLPTRPSITIGNLSVGGTGKTPLVKYISTFLSPQYRVKILSRGYGRKTKGYLRVEKKHTAFDVGDEPLEYVLNQPGMQVFVCEDRVLGFQTLIRSDTQTDLVLLDDAFQHRRFQAGLQILVTPYYDLYVDDFILPSGRLRESRNGANRADIIIVSKCPNTIGADQRSHIQGKLKLQSHQSLFFTGLNYGTIFHFQSGTLLNNDTLKMQSVLLFTGIGNNQPIVNYLTPIVTSIEVRSFPDHHQFSEPDLKAFDEIQKKNSQIIFITTMKDAARLSIYRENPILAGLQLYILPVSITFASDKEERDFQKIIVEYVRKNK